MKIIAIGNSFSQDCTAYLERLTDDDVTVRNLFIGGCSLERHAGNIKDKRAEYELQRHGERIGDTLVSINEMLTCDDWDVITVQEVSGNSGKYEVFAEHLREVLAAVRALCPRARIVWNQTWSYASYSTHGRFADYDRDTEKMHWMIDASAHRAAEEHGLGLIETGRAIHTLRHTLTPDGTELCRDGFHLSFTDGRYAAAYVWARYFDLSVNDFVPDGADAARICKIREILDAEL